MSDINMMPFAPVIAPASNGTTDKRDGWPRPCKFDPDEHGLFAGTRPLSEHYREVHGQQPKPHSSRAATGETKYARAKRIRAHAGPWRCICGYEADRKKSMVNHASKAHPDADWLDITTTIVQPSVEVEHVPARARRSKFAPTWSESDLNDIVMPVMRNLAEPGGVIPVDHLETVFKWRDDTRSMLRAITDHDD